MDIEQWHKDRSNSLPSVRDLIKGANGNWKREGYKVSIDHDSTETSRKGHSLHVVAKSPAGKEVGRYIFNQDGNNHTLTVDTADTHGLHQRKGLATEAYRLIEHHTGMQVQRGSVQTPQAEALWSQPQPKFGALAKAVDKNEFHNTVDAGKSATGNTFVDHLPHMNLSEGHAQYVHDVQHPDKKMPSGVFDEGISPKMVHKMPYGTFMMKPFHEEGMPHSGLATMTAKNIYNAGNISHLNEDASATMISHPENPDHKIPMVVSKFNSNAAHMNEVPSNMVNPKESAQINMVDYLMGNDDRHEGNSMVQRDKANGEGKLSPMAIDHGYAFSYGDHNSNLANMIGASAHVNGHGKVLDHLTDKHREELGDWYKEHGDKMHQAMLDSTASIQDPNLKAHLRNNFSARHKAMDRWAWSDDRSKHGFASVDAMHDEHATHRGEASLDAMDNFDMEGGKNIHQLKEMFDEHKPMGWNQDIFFAQGQRKLHEVNPQGLSDYFTSPAKDEKETGFKNQLLHRFVTSSEPHPQHKQIMLNLLAENKKHPDHAKPIHPYMQKVMERELHRPDVPTWGGAHNFNEAPAESFNPFAKAK